MINRRALVISVAILIACIVNIVFKLPESIWTPFATLMVLQMPSGSQLRQAIVVMFVLIVTILFAASSALLGLNTILSVIFIALTIVFAGYIYLINPNSRRFNKFLLILIPFSLTLAASWQENSMLLAEFRCIEVVIGGFIGYIFARLFLKFDSEKNFKQQILPIIQCMRHYTEEFANNFAELNAFPQKESSKFIMQMMEHECRDYPEWIYTPGFNPGLRSGMRFFLIHTERLSEILFSLEYLLKQPVTKDRWQHLSERLSVAMQGNKELLNALSDNIENKSVTISQENFTQDIIDLENALNDVVPTTLELVDMNAANLILTAVVREMKDMRNLLLQLVLIMQKATYRGDM